MAEITPASDASLKEVTDQLKQQNFKLTQIRNIGEAQVEAAADAASIAAEAAREAARAGDDKDDKEIAIKVETEESPGLFKKLKLGGLAMSFLGSAMTGLTTAFAWLGKAFGPKALAALGKIAPWAMILTGLTMAIEDGITGWMNAESWGTSKVSGFLGGFFGGAAKGGIKNAFANAGKFALIGAGIGTLVVPVVGTIVGGLAGAVIGGILGWIGGEKLAKGFDGIGAWFYKQFETLVLGPIKAVWDFIAPDWAKAVTDKMVWSDLLPPGLAKLFNGEYFTFDMPEFTWTDIFPKFLVDLFTNVTKVVGATSWSWMDLLPPFLTKFFTGEYAPGKQEFKWQDLVPEFIWKVIEVAKTAWADTPFTWRSLVPNFILKIIDGFSQTGTFSWTDLVPKFISDLVTAGKEAGKTEDGGFDWTKLLPDWMGAAWGSTKGLIKQAGGGHLLEGEWWLGLLPDFLADILKDDKKVAKVAQTAGLAMDWWKSLLPDFIVNIMEGKSPFADRDESADLKKAEEAKKKLGAGMSETAAVLGLPSGEQMLAGVDWSMFDFGTWFMGKLDLDLGQKLKGMLSDVIGFQEGGMVTGTGLAMLHGTSSSPEFVLDNEATASFLQAVEILSGTNLAELQRESTGGMMQAAAAPITVVTSPTTQINQSSGVMLPGMPIEPSNGQSQLN